MAGVIAHRKAIVSSANALGRVTLISVPRFADTIRTKVLFQGRFWTTFRCFAVILVTPSHRMSRGVLATRSIPNLGSGA